MVSHAAARLAPLTRLIGLEVDLESLLDALAPRGISGFDFGSRETLSKTIPSANGLFTARSLARMYAALANGGEIDGVRLLSRATLARATELQVATAGRSVIPFDMRWRLGYHGVATTRGFLRRAYGHFGFGGSGAWAEPNRRLAVALIVNSGMGTPFGDLRIVRVGGAAVACADRRSPRGSVEATPARNRKRRGRAGPQGATVSSYGRDISGRRKAASARRNR